MDPQREGVERITQTLDTTKSGSSLVLSTQPSDPRQEKQCRSIKHAKFEEYLWSDQLQHLCFMPK